MCSHLIQQCDNLNLRFLFEPPPTITPAPPNFNVDSQTARAKRKGLNIEIGGRGEGASNKTVSGKMGSGSIRWLQDFPCSCFPGAAENIFSKKKSQCVSFGPPTDN